MTKVLFLIAQFFVITAAIVSGAYLTLRVYAQEQQTQQQINAKKAIVQLQEELKANALKVGLSFDYHQVVRDSLEGLFKNKEEVINARNVRVWKGLMAPELQGTRYNVLATRGKLAGIADSLLQKITTAYGLQKQLAGLGSPTMDFWWQTELANRPKATARALAGLMDNYCKTEKKLMTLYEGVFEIIRKSKRMENKHLLKP